MYPQRIVSLYQQFRSGKLGKDEFRRQFERLMGRPCTREDLRQLDSEITSRNIYFRHRRYLQ